MAGDERERLVHVLCRQREPDDGVLDLLAESSLGRPETVDAAEVARVVDRLDAADREPDGAVQAWTREFTRLCRAADLRSALDDGGVELTGELRGVAAWPALFADRTLDVPGVAERVVEALGESWEASGFRALFGAARRTRQRASGPALLHASGLVGVRAPDRDAARAWIEAPVDGLPVVRGREREIARLAAAVEEGDGPVQVLLGSGGYGKSTVALAVAARVRTEDRQVLRLPAADLDELVDGLYLAAASTGATQRGLERALRTPPAERAERLWRLLDASPQPWVLLLDDVGAGVAGHPMLTRGSGGGTVLITTRYGDRDVWAGCAVTELDRLPADQGGLVVLDAIEPGRHRAGPAARALSRLLGGVPLALTTAGRLAAAGRVTETQLAERIRRMRATNPVSAVYEIGVGASGGELRTAIRLLSCFCPDEPLPLAVLDRTTGVPDLVGNGLVERRLRSGWPCLTLHAALAEQSRRDSAIRPSETAEVTGRAIALLRRQVGELDAGSPDGWPLLRLLEPHVTGLLASAALGDPSLLAEAVLLAERTASALLRSGDQVAAVALLADALRRSGELDERHPARLALRHTRAWTTALDGGNFVGAECELRDVLALRARLLGDTHPDTLATRDRLSWVLAERGAPEEAGRIAAEVLATRRELLGETHPHTLATRHRLAWIDGLLGRDRDAVAGFTEVLRLRRRRLGPAHLDVYSTRYRLGWALSRAADYDEAETVYRDLQSDLERAVGPEHPLTLMVRVRVGEVLVWRARLDEAERQYADVLADQEKVLGADHLRVLRTRHLQACVALNRGDVTTAVERMRPVVTERKARLGPDHPHTLDSRSYLAWMLLQAGQTDAADRRIQAIVADRQRVLGELDPVTLHTRYLLVRARIRRGRLDEAQPMARRLLDDERRVLPAEHRYVFNARHTLAVVNARRGRLATAEQELRAVLADRERVLGPDHRETLATRDHLVWVLRRQGRIADGTAEATATLADRTRVLGPRHPHTLTSRYRLARLVESEQLFTELLADLRDVLGPDHPDTLRCRHALVRQRRRTGDPEVAQRWAHELLADQVRVRGQDAVETLRTTEELGRALLALPGRAAEGQALLDDVTARRSALFGVPGS